MEIIYKKGNLLNAQTNVIAHQVNCQGVMGSGVAKQIKEKWPDVFDAYKYYVNLVAFDHHTEKLLGRCFMVLNTKKQYVANLFGQDNYGRDSKRYTSYDAIYESLISLASQMIGDGMISLAIPYKMSSDRGGADWNVILAMIESVFKNTNISIEIWELEQS